MARTVLEDRDSVPFVKDNSWDCVLLFRQAGCISSQSYLYRNGLYPGDDLYSMLTVTDQCRLFYERFQPMSNAGEYIYILVIAAIIVSVLPAGICLDGLHLPRRYACNEFHHHHLQGVQRLRTAAAALRGNGDERPYP